jgi:uncharacterized protein
MPTNAPSSVTGTPYTSIISAAADGRAAPVAERERIVSLDVMRGVALLGILLMNIQSFAMPSDAYLNPTAYGDLTGANRWVWILTHLLADQKFISIFSMLFGAGILLLAEHVGPARATRVHYRRMGVLLVFGLIHAHALWSGDILYTYAICGMAVYLARRLTPRTLIVTGLALHAVSSVFFVGNWFLLRGASPDVIAIVTRDYWVSSPADLARELAGYRGNWLAQQAFRGPDATSMETFIFLIDTAWKTSGLMLVGMALFKLDVFSARGNDAFYRRMMLLGFGVGLPVVAYGVWRNFETGWGVVYSLFLGYQFNYWGSIAVALGWVGLVMLLVRSGRASALVRRLGAVGRTAFSNYILQTLLGIVIFYGTGLGLFGKVDRVGQLLVVVAIWTVQLAIAPLWLRYFAFGPLEWLWRSLTYGKAQPMRVAAA